MSLLDFSCFVTDNSCITPSTMMDNDKDKDYFQKPYASLETPVHPSHSNEKYHPFSSTMPILAFDFPKDCFSSHLPTEPISYDADDEYYPSPMWITTTTPCQKEPKENVIPPADQVLSDVQEKNLFFSNTCPKPLSFSSLSSNNVEFNPQPPRQPEQYSRRRRRRSNRNIRRRHRRQHKNKLRYLKKKHLEWSSAAAAPPPIPKYVYDSFDSTTNMDEMIRHFDSKLNLTPDKYKGDVLFLHPDEEDYKYIFGKVPKHACLCVKTRC